MIQYWSHSCTFRILILDGNTMRRVQCTIQFDLVKAIAYIDNSRIIWIHFVCLYMCATSCELLQIPWLYWTNIQKGERKRLRLKSSIWGFSTFFQEACYYLYMKKFNAKKSCILGWRFDRNHNLNERVNGKMADIRLDIWFFRIFVKPDIGLHLYERN